MSIRSTFGPHCNFELLDPTYTIILIKIIKLSSQSA